MVSTEYHASMAWRGETDTPHRQGNKITKLPEALKDMKGMKRVTLTGCPLVEDDPGTTAALAGLKGACEANGGKFLGAVAVVSAVVGLKGKFGAFGKKKK
jgi:hypothetical protein